MSWQWWEVEPTLCPERFLQCTDEHPIAEEICLAGCGGLAKLKDRMEKLSMSARAFDRILRVAHTIEDLEMAGAKSSTNNK